MSWVSDAIAVDTMQVTARLRKGEQGLFFWCPGCEEMHLLPNTWTFDGNLECPTFTPSFKVTQHHEPHICHFVITQGVVHYQGDCAHSLRGTSIPMPLLPVEYRDQ